jgi:hypothetical protein
MKDRLITDKRPGLESIEGAELDLWPIRMAGIPDFPTPQSSSTG